MLPILATALIIFLGAVTGAYPVRRIIEIREAKHELKHGSAGFIRTTAGWVIIVIWLAAIWFFATITGDWFVTGDLEGAMERSTRRLEVLLRILAALSDD